jgi:carbonic anhydrase
MQPCLPQEIAKSSENKGKGSEFRFGNRVRHMKRLILYLAAQAWACAAPAAGGPADWVSLSDDKVKMPHLRPVELDKASIRAEESGLRTAWTRRTLPKDDAAAGSSPVVKSLNRYDCAKRSYVAVKREYLHADMTVGRVEDVKDAKAYDIKAGTPEELLLKEVCKAPLATEAGKLAEKAGKAAPAAAKAPPQKAAARPPAAARGSHARAAHEPHWGYEGHAGPAGWGRLKKDFAACASGSRQSPIDIRDGVDLDLPAIRFDYKPVPLRIVDNGHTIQVNVAPGSSINLMGRDYALAQFHFHKPSEEAVNGRRYDMVAHLVHKDEAGRLAVVAVLIEAGTEHPLMQTLWTYLPLEKNAEVAPPDVAIDLRELLPKNLGYYTYMGSLTTPPCSEGVLWLVLKTPIAVSQEQIAVFARLYRMNARPLQPARGRLVKESR